MKAYLIDPYETTVTEVTDEEGDSVSPKTSLTKLKSMIDFIPEIFIVQAGTL